MLVAFNTPTPSEAERLQQPSCAMQNYQAELKSLYRKEQPPVQYLYNVPPALITAPLDAMTGLTQAFSIGERIWSNASSAYG